MGLNFDVSSPVFIIGVIVVFFGFFIIKFLFGGRRW